MIVIIDYEMGNLHSIFKALAHYNFSAVVSSTIDDIEKAEKIILPGVGSFARGMSNLSKLGLVKILNKKVLEEKTPILGICLGMQLFTKRSEEGDSNGLGWIDCQTRKFRFDEKNNLKIPHIGWNNLITYNHSPILSNIPDDTHFYFVHSYHIPFSGEAFVTATTRYGYEFTSVIRQDNIYGTQFHPEKSHKTGFKILKNFMEEI